MGFTLVTGGGKRLGANICCALAKEGYDVLVHYRTSKIEADDVVKECLKYGVKAFSIQGDFTTLESTNKFILACKKEYSQIHNLINNVGNYSVGSALETSTEELKELYQVNFLAPLECIKAFLPSIKANKGSIVNLGVAGLETSRTTIHTPAYRSTKLNLLMLTRSMALELAPFGVSVNMVSPGYLDISIESPKPDTLPMRRFGTLDEVSRLILFLISRENRYITGQNIEVAGAVQL